MKVGIMFKSDFISKFFYIVFMSVVHIKEK